MNEDITPEDVDAWAEAQAWYHSVAPYWIDEDGNYDVWIEETYVDPAELEDR